MRHFITFRGIDDGNDIRLDVSAICNSQNTSVTDARCTKDLKSSADGMRPLLDPKKPTQDGWGNDFQLRIVDNGFLEVRSAGADGQMNTSDDITNRGK